MTRPPWDNDTARAHGITVAGTGGHLIEVSARISNGLSVMQIRGLPETGTREMRDRIRAAVLNSALPWPERTITVRLQPPAPAGRVSGLDLPIAAAILAAASAVPAQALDGYVFLAELGLDGTLRPVPGLATALTAAPRAGWFRAVVARQDETQATTVPGITVLACPSLRELLARLRAEHVARHSGTAPTTAGPLPAAGLAGLAVSPAARLALETSAAGGHHLCLTGPRRAPIAGLAAGMAGLLPPLDHDEAAEVIAIHSAAGLQGPGRALVTQPPFRAPHHTATMTTVLGGGPGAARPGEAALAHRGVLFLGDAPEFARQVLHALGQPLREGRVTVARSASLIWYPAKFTLIAGLPPCPCGGQPGCDCSPLAATRYRARLTGELGGHIAIWLHVPPGPVPAGQEPTGKADSISAERVAEARSHARDRLAGSPWQVNADIPGAQLRRTYQPPAEALAPIRRALDIGEISQRAADRIIRMAWTLADLDGRAQPAAEDCGQALAFALGVTP